MVRESDNKKSGKEEEISTRFFLMAWSRARKIIAILINKSVQEEVFPANWKTSTIVPIPKIPGSIKANEHRPINKLPFYEK